jgi:hypothetical protein
MIDPGRPKMHLLYASAMSATRRELPITDLTAADYDELHALWRATPVIGL